MQKFVNDIIGHMSFTHQHMARVLDAERQKVIRMSQIVHALPDVHPQFEGISGLKEQSSILTKSIVSYLNGLAELEEAMAEQLEQVVKELQDEAEE